MWEESIDDPIRAGGTKRMRILLPAFVVLCVWVAAAEADDVPQIPRIDSVVMSKPQPQESDAAVIWYDDFDGPAKPYTETEGELDTKEAFGGEGRSMLGFYEEGRQGRGNRKVFFGDSPTGKVVKKGKHFDDIYWRDRERRSWAGRDRRPFPAAGRTRHPVVSELIRQQRQLLQSQLYKQRQKPTRNRPARSARKRLAGVSTLDGQKRAFQAKGRQTRSWGL
jgi:hypothetical protein